MDNANHNTRAEVILPSKELNKDIDFFTKTIGMQLNEIFPADDPSVAVISGYGLRVRLDKDSNAPASSIKIHVETTNKLNGCKNNLIAPNGCIIELVEINPS